MKPISIIKSPLASRGKCPAGICTGLVTTLKTALIHPIIQNVPLDLKTSISLFRNLHAALGLVNLNFHDTRRDDNYITLEVGSDKANPALLVSYSPTRNEGAFIQKALKKVKKALWKLKCIVPPGMIHVRPMGASVHYAGTIPMSGTKSPLTTSEYCSKPRFR